jgi:hypothetical protein
MCLYEDKKVSRHVYENVLGVSILALSTMSRHSSLHVFIRPDIKNGQLDWIHANEPKPAKNCLLQVDYHIESSIMAMP